jgi:TolB-like protein
LSAAILSDGQVEVPALLPPNIRTAIAGCLVRDPKQRYGRATDVRAALGGDPTTVPATPLPPVETRPDLDTVLTVTLTRRRALWMAIVPMAAAGAGFAWWRLSSADTRVRTLAVLPLTNTAADPDLEYLCDGITESLIQQVSKLRSFRVRPLGVVLPYKGPSADPVAAGRQLRVETVLAGTFERQVERLRISARLVDVADGRQLWAGTYDRDAATLLDVQDEIASAIMDTGLRVRLTSDERQQLVRHPTTDADAYDLYLQARYSQRLATEEDYLESRSLLEKAIVRDTQFALAYAALSGNYAMMAVDGLERPTDAWPQVSRYMRQALEIDPSLPEALVMEHARVFLFDWDWEAAESARRRFLAAPVGDFDPQFARALAVELWAMGRTEEALQLARRTRELDTRSPYLAILEADYLLRSDQYEAAIALYEYAIGLDPGNSNALFGLAEARMRQGRWDEAIEARREAHAVAGDDRLAPLFANAKGEAGYRQIDEAWVRLQIDMLKEREKTRYVSPLDFARAYAQLADKELTFKHIEAAFVDRSPGLVFLKVDRAWDRVRDDPRFAAAIRQVGLP